MLNSLGTTVGSASAALLLMAWTQPVPVLRLKAPSALYAEEFTRVGSVRELADMRVLVADEKEQRVVVLSQPIAGAVAVGARGYGPGEYQQLSRLWPLAGDSTLLLDLTLHRWLVFHGAKIVTASSALARPIPLLSDVISGADRFGNVVAGRPSSKDSGTLIRANRTSARVDTISRLAPVAPVFYAVADDSPTRPANRSPFAAPPKPPKSRLGLDDDAILFLDGWVAIARANPYRVDWCEGRVCTRGPVLGTARRFVAADTAGVMHVANRAGDLFLIQYGMQPGMWPDSVGAFATRGFRDGSALLAMPDGRLLVRRFTPADTTNANYDIVDRTGRVAVRVQTRVTERIAGFGAQSVYTVATNDDGVERLRRHPWP